MTLFQFFGVWCFYLVCGVAVPNNEFAILGGADQKPDEKKDKIAQTSEQFKMTLQTRGLKPADRYS